MLRIADLRKMEVRVNVNENDTSEFTSMTVNIDVDAYASEKKTLQRHRDQHRQHSKG